MAMNLIEIGHEIRQRRLNKQLSLEQLAEQAHLNKATLSRYENGKIQNISLETFIAISSILGIKLSDFDIESGRFIQATEDIAIKGISKTVNELTDERRQAVWDFAKEQLATQKTLQVKKTYAVVLADGVLSAGTGEFLDTNNERFAVRVPEPVPSKYDYAFKINGHSMEPFYQDGQVIFLQQRESYRSGQIVAAIVNGSSFLKRIQVEEDCIKLVSLNKVYPNVTVTNNDNYRILGCVFS